MSSPANQRMTRSHTRSNPAAHSSAAPDGPSNTPPAKASPPSPIDLTSDDASAASASTTALTSATEQRGSKRKRSYFDQTPRRVTHARLQSQPRDPSSRRFDYSLDYANLDLREQPHLYRVGVSEQGVLLCQPYKSEILPLWRFKTPQQAAESAAAIERQWREYGQQSDFIGQDMARKFLQMGYTRSRRYANHKSGRKYDEQGRVLALEVDSEKAESAEVFRVVWKRVEADEEYKRKKAEWKKKYG